MYQVTNGMQAVNFDIIGMCVINFELRYASTEKNLEVKVALETLPNDFRFAVVSVRRDGEVLASVPRGVEMFIGGVIEQAFME